MRRVIYEDERHRVSTVDVEDGVWIHVHCVADSLTRSIKVPDAALSALGAAILVDGKVREFLK